MFLKIDDFTSEWAREMRLTEEAMDALTDVSLLQTITNEHRTLGQLAWHLVKSIHFMTHCGLTFEGPTGGEQVPQSAAIITENYRRMGLSLQHALKMQWNDKNLHETQKIMGEEWANGASLRYVIMHQAHHRGQMTVLMRQAGLRIPEIYGPTYESWIEKGLAPLT